MKKQKRKLKLNNINLYKKLMKKMGNANCSMFCELFDIH